jgi:uncharacterized membrane protein
VLVTVCRDIEVASVLVQAGAQVVLGGTDGAVIGEAIGDLRSAGPAGARIAALVGDLADPETQASAVAMARELFGGEPTVVLTVSAALQLDSHLPGPQPKGSGTV